MTTGPAMGLWEEPTPVVVAMAGGCKVPCALTPLASEEISILSKPSGFALLSLFLITMIHSLENMKTAEKSKEVEKQLVMVHYPEATTSKTGHMVSSMVCCFLLLYTAEAILYS